MSKIASLNPRKTLVRSAAGAALLAAGLGLGWLPAAASAAEIVGRLSYHWGPAHTSAIFAKEFADEVTKRSKGRLRIDTFPAGQLFGIREIQGALTAGSVEMGGVVGIISYPPVVKNFTIASFPGLFKSFEDQRKFFTEDKVGSRVWNAVSAKTRTRVVMYNPVGPFMSFSTKSKMDSIASMKGLKARALFKTERPRWKALNVKMISLPTREVYTSLQTGMIDTLNTVPNGLKAYSWWEYLKFGQLPYQAFADAYLTANSAWFDGLPKDLQQIILDVGKEVGAKSSAQIMKASDDLLKEFQGRGGVVTVLQGAAKAEFDKLSDEVVFPALAELVDADVLKAAQAWSKK
ncbi:MAG TPA: TRAP transporter substrate-binding protein [Alphaproteobacteria bacterium]|nr:TRAP transporter substrate-binding protein [Alphaproteobacteria bacterium]MDP6269290.1 TRAP transporter substrate-binding protein [Alphaproteobacteria bacterium]HJM52021.1 TRAP transporter substrate-binding protein [Alphaproteobacteria bacterium]